VGKIIELQIPINRVEGDLDIRVSIENGVIVDAKSIGTLYRGFENILVGKDPMDALVITPRVCGICSISHLTAAVKAIEDANDIKPPMQAVRLRNISIICENLQSDIRQVFLMFMPDFAHKYYQNHSFYDATKRLFAPVSGEMVKSVLNSTKDLLKIIAYIGGQWPHTSHMIPGGITMVNEDLDIFNIRYLILKFKKWYEEKVLGISIKEFSQITSFKDLEAYMLDYPNSQISIFTKISQEIGLEKIGKTGYGFINYGSIDLEDNSTLVPKSYYDNKLHDLDLSKITEDVTYSWYDADILNPSKGITKPNTNKEKAYSFTKAPRYNNKVYQTGALGEELACKNKLIVDIYNNFKDSVFSREFARMIRGIRYIAFLEKEIENVIKYIKEPLYNKPKLKQNCSGIGITHAARGALGHWINIKDGKIKNYQIISPTTWNGSPKDSNNNYGPWEKALIGTKVDDVNNPMQMGHVIRSFDPCLVCTVHFMGDKDKKISLKV